MKIGPLSVTLNLRSKAGPDGSEPVTRQEFEDLKKIVQRTERKVYRDISSGDVPDNLKQKVEDTQKQLYASIFWGGD